MEKFVCRECGKEITEDDGTICDDCFGYEEDEEFEEDEDDE